MAKISINTRPPASSYRSGGERIIEVGNGRHSAALFKGALISIRELGDGRLCVEVYRAGAGVVVRCEPHTIEAGGD